MTGVLIHDSLRRGIEDAQACMTRCLTLKELVYLIFIQGTTSSWFALLLTYCIPYRKALREICTQYSGAHMLKIDDFSLT